MGHVQTSKYIDKKRVFEDDIYSFNITTPSLDPLMGEDMTDIDMTDLECNSPVIIPQMQDETTQEGAQEQQHQQNQKQHQQLTGGFSF